jgi:hypothetical protein
LPIDNFVECEILLHYSLYFDVNFNPKLGKRHFKSFQQLFKPCSTIFSHRDRILDIPTIMFIDVRDYWFSRRRFRSRSFPVVTRCTVAVRYQQFGRSCCIHFLDEQKDLELNSWMCFIIGLSAIITSILKSFFCSHFLAPRINVYPMLQTCGDENSSCGRQVCVLE